MTGSSKIEQLTKENYDSWSMQVEALMVKNNTWMYVCGEKRKPNVIVGDAASVAAANNWTKKDRKAKADLILAISPYELQHVCGCETSRDIWMKLQSIYASRGPARKATLLKQLALQKLSEGEDIRDHMSRFFDARDKLAIMEIDINEDLMSILLLYSLPPSYENFRCAIESRDELPGPLDLKIKIFEENDARKQKIRENESGAMFAWKNSKGYGNKYYGNGRSENNLKFKSKDLTERPRFFQDTSKIRCYRCNQIGHKENACLKRDEETLKVSSETYDRVEETCFQTQQVRNRRWCLDSGCTSHMSHDDKQFSEMKIVNQGRLNLASNASTIIDGKGNVHFIETDGKHNQSVILQDTLLVRDLRTNLISVAKITDHDNKIIFTNTGAIVEGVDGNIRMVADRIGNLFYAREGSDKSYVVGTDAQFSSSELWHQRLGHINNRDMTQMVKKGAVIGIDINSNAMMSSCETCLRGKLAAILFPDESKRCSKLLEIVHSDLCGPMRTESKGKAKHFITYNKRKVKSILEVQGSS